MTLQINRSLSVTTVIYLTFCIAFVGCQRDSSPKIVQNPEALTVNMPESEPVPTQPQVLPSNSGAPVVSVAPAANHNPSPPAGEVVKPVPPNSEEAVASPPAAIDTAQEASDWEKWPTPQCVLVITGQQFGYIEPCGCTGLENQKGGMMRRHTLVKQLAGKGWPLVPLDVGNQERRPGPQAVMKFQTAVEGLSEMGYRAVGFGPDDLRLGVENLLSVETGPELKFISANVTLFDPTLLANIRVITVGGRRIGVTAALDPDRAGKNISGEITVSDPIPGLKKALQDLEKEGCNDRVLMWYGDNASANKLLNEVPGWDFVVLGDDPGEPEFQPAKAENSEARFIRVGHKGMHVCLIGLFDDQSQPWRYARIPLTHQFEDSPEMLKRMAAYQDSLKAAGLTGLGLRPILHPTGRKYVGSEKCGECHTTAFGIWEKTPHARATEDLVHPPNNRSSIPRHFDPECLSCHATGWNPQSYYPYETGYLSLDATPHMVGNGCENCHGPGATHVAAEEGAEPADDDRLAALRESMRLPLAKARERCLECHDTDNSPDFGHEGAFEKYWKDVEHIGKD